MKEQAKSGRKLLEILRKQNHQRWRQSTKKILHEDNASDIYDSLKEPKGSALKVAQMLSMEKYNACSICKEKFSLAVFCSATFRCFGKKTFRKIFRKNPEDIFWGIFHQNRWMQQVLVRFIWRKRICRKNPISGVQESISSDLKLVKPIAMKMFNIQKRRFWKAYFKEVEDKLYEETNYILELERSQNIAKNCAHIPNLKFPNYYPEFSSEKSSRWIDARKTFFRIHQRKHSQLI